MSPSLSSWCHSGDPSSGLRESSFQTREGIQRFGPAHLLPDGDTEANGSVFRTSERTTIAAGFLTGAVALVLFGWFVGPRRVLSTLSGLRLRPFSLGLVAVGVALFAQYRGLLALLDLSPAVDSGLAYLRGVYVRQLVPVGSVAGPVLIVYSMRRSTGVSTDRGLPAAIISQAVNFLTATLVGLVGSVLLLGHGHRSLLPLVGVLTVVLVSWIAGLGAFVSGVGIERTVTGSAAVIYRTVGRASSVVARKTAPENVREWLAGFDDTRRLIRDNPARVVVAVAWSGIAWILLSLTLISTAPALGIAVPLGVAFLVLPASDLLNALPVPGGIGGVEVAMAALLVALTGIDVSVAAVAAFCVRLCTYWFVLLLGGAATAVLSTGFGSA